MGEMIGYARVSSVGQSLEVQLDRLGACDRVFEEKRSGITANRPQLHACLNYLREGDTLVITKLDRLARSTYHLTQLAQSLQEKKIDLQVLDQQIDTTTPTGRLLFNVLASIAEFETEIRKERQLEGIVKAKAKGIQFGRKRKTSKSDRSEIREARKSGETVSNLMRRFGLSKATIYRILQADT